jgi:hypothetical protein
VREVEDHKIMASAGPRKEEADVRPVLKPYRAHLKITPGGTSVTHMSPKSSTDIAQAHFYRRTHGTSHPRPLTGITPTSAFPPLRRLPGCQQSRKARPRALEGPRGPLQGERETAGTARACTARPLDRLFADARTLLLAPFLRTDRRRECRLLSTLRATGAPRPWSSSSRSPISTQRTR